MIGLFGFATPVTQAALKGGDLFVSVSYRYKALCLRAAWGDEAVAIILRETGRFEAEHFPYVAKMSALADEVARVDGDIVARPSIFDPAPFLGEATSDPRTGALLLTQEATVLQVSANFRPAYFTLSGKHLADPPRTGFAYRDWSLVWRHGGGEEALVSFPYTPARAG